MAVLFLTKNIKKMNSFNQIIKSDTPVLVDFFATWCGPCQMLSPILKQVKDSLGNRVSILKIDVDKKPNCCFTISSSRGSHNDIISKRKTIVAPIRCNIQRGINKNYR